MCRSSVWALPATPARTTPGGDRWHAVGHTSAMKGQTFRLWWVRLLAGGAFGFMAAGMLDWLDLFWPLALLAVPFAWASVRAFRSGIQLTDDGVVVRGFSRTKSAPWSEVVQVRDTSGSSTGLPWRIPEFVLEDDTIKAQGFRTLRRQGSIVDDLIEASRDRLDGRRSSEA